MSGKGGNATLALVFVHSFGPWCLGHDVRRFLGARPVKSFPPAYLRASSAKMDLLAMVAASEPWVTAQATLGTPASEASPTT